jgi:UrcA family protein
MNTLKYSQKFAVLAVAALSVAFFAVAAQAGDAPLDVGSRAVRYSDLNLSSEAGAKVLYRRIYYAAVQVCGDAFSRQLDQAAAAKACMDKAIASSVRAVNSAQLTRTANAHGYSVETSISVASVR